MVDITASTTHSVKKAKATGKPPSATISATKKAGTGGAVASGAAAHRGAVPPALKPVALAQAAAIASLKSKSVEDQKIYVLDLFHKTLGDESVVRNIAKPHAASTTRDRSGAAADVAIAARELGVVFVLKDCQILEHMQRILFPAGIGALFAQETLKPSASALSLSSLMEGASIGATSETVNSAGTDSKRGKTTPPVAREGCLLLIRALCGIVGKPAEPFLVGAFLAAALDECGSSSLNIRQAAEDTTVVIVALAHPWAFPAILCPLLIQALDSTEWRVKVAALERLQQCCSTAPMQVQKLIPRLIPALTNQVWDTKPQVQKAARGALTAICNTNTNADIQPAIGALVNAICKPADTNKAVSELMGTTFVVPVEASTLAILCPILSRALKEKLAIHKRAACIVISNMSKLVVSPSAVAPFGSLLVPELTKVANNVQFEEIRDEALKALAALTKALGDLYHEDENHQQQQHEMEQEQARIEAEQERIEQDRLETQRKEEEQRRKEEEEREKFKQAMEAQRQLDLLAAEEARKKKEEEETKREMQKRSTKSESGQCQMCGLKKCKKSCMFYKPT